MTNIIQPGHLAGGKKRKAPAFQLYASDWLGSTRIALMTPAQEGAYLHLLCHAWGDEHCSLPADDESLAMLSRLGADWAKLKDRILDCFDPHPEIPGRLINRKLFEVRRGQEAYAAQQRVAGQQGAASRWGRHRNVDGERMASLSQENADPMDAPLAGSMASDGSPSPSSSPSPSPSSSPSPVVVESDQGSLPGQRPRRVGRATWLTPFVEDWAREIGGEMPIGQAAVVLRPLVEQHGEAAVRAHLQRFLRAHQGGEARFLSLQKFGQTFGAWDGREPASPDQRRGPRTASEVSMANVRKVLAEVKRP